MNKDIITIQDCLDMHNKKGQATVIENGKVIGFRKECKKIHIFAPKYRVDTKEKAPQVGEHQRSQRV